MKTLFTTITLLMMLVSVRAFAGGSGGGGVLMSALQADMPEIVYHIDSRDGVVQFQYGKLYKSRWQIDYVEIEEEELRLDNSAHRAVEASKFLRAWQQID